MQINTVASQLRDTIYHYTNHTDFSKEGNLAFKKKEKLLIDMSKAPQILPAALLLLENDDNQQIRFFTTMIIKDKLKFDFYQLDQTSIATLHQRLVNAIQIIPNPSKPVLNNLSLCLVYLYIHCINSIGSVMNFFTTVFPPNSTVNETSKFLYFFKYLETLPEEIYSQTLVIDQEARDNVIELLKQQQTQLLNQMHNVYVSSQKQQMTVHVQAVLIDAFANWLELAETHEQIAKNLHQHALMNLALSSFGNDQLSAPAMRCLLVAVGIMKNPDNNEELYQFLGRNLFALISEVESQIKEDYMEPAENFLNVLCDYGSFSADKLVASFNSQIQNFFLKMIKFSENKDLDVFKAIVDFWECIIHAIITRPKDSPLSDEIAYQIIARIYTVFCSRIEYNNEEIQDLNEMSEKILVNLHQRVQDNLDRREESRYIFEAVLNFLGRKSFVKEVVTLITNLSPSDSNYYSKIQSHIFSLRDAVVDYPESTEQICQVVLIFEKLENAPKILKKSFLRVFEGLFSIKEKNQEFILRVLSNVTSMFDDKILSDKVDSAYTKCCKENGVILVKQLNSLFTLYETYPNRESTIRGIIYVLRDYPDLLNEHLPHLLKIPFQKLQGANSKSKKREAFEDLFAMIMAVPEGKNEGNENILEILLREIWPNIKEILLNPRDKVNEKLIEKCIKFLKLIMRKIPLEFIKYLNEIFMVLIEVFQKEPIGTYLYFYEVTFITYHSHNNAELQNYLKNLYIQYTTIAASHLSSDDSISENQKLADDFIGLNKRLVAFHLRMFLECGQFQSVLKFATACLGSNVPKAASVASQFFETILMIYWTAYSRKKWEQQDVGEAFVWKQTDVELYNQLKGYLLPLVPTLIQQMFTFLSESRTDTAKDNIKDCLLAIGLAFPQYTGEIWNAPLQCLSEDILTRTEKQRLIESLGKLGQDNHEEFLKGEGEVKKLIYLINRRFKNRQQRSKLQIK